MTSRDSNLDEVRALSLGGDDYITKPYNVPVLLARIKAVLRRGCLNQIRQTKFRQLSPQPGYIDTESIVVNINPAVP